jgi:hypothetical protein
LQAGFDDMHEKNQQIRQYAASTFEALVDVIKEHSVEQIESLGGLYKQRDNLEDVLQEREAVLLEKAQEIDLEEVEAMIDQVLDCDKDMGFGLSL